MTNNFPRRHVHFKEKLTKSGLGFFVFLGFFFLRKVNLLGILLWKNMYALSGI